MSIDKKLLQAIKMMFEVDQDLRLQCVANKKIQVPLFEMNNKDYGKIKGEKLLKGASLGGALIYILDNVHNIRIWNIIDKYGYPTSKLIGKNGMHYFHILIQHQDYDLKLQEECLKKCDFSPKDKAYLTDRVLLNSGKKQIYGTQFFFDKKIGKLEMKPVENSKMVNRKRKEVGIGPWEKDFAKIMKRMK